MLRVLPPKTTSDPTPLQAVADKHRRAFADAILAALVRVKASLSQAKIRSELSSVGSVGVEPDWSRFWDLAKADTPVYEVAYLHAMLDGAEAEENPSLRASLQIVNERAVDAAKLRAAELVVGLSRESRLAVQQTLGTTLSGGGTVASAAREIKDVIGLDTSRARAVVNYRAALEAGRNPGNLLADGRFSVSSLTSEKIDTMVSRYAERQLAARASMISRTETIRAAHDGQKALWDAAADQGLFDRSEAQRVWIVTDDDRLCDQCSPLDGEPVAYEGTFDNGQGDVAEYPPLHPGCRCTTSLDI